jgi:hypothetical protein
MPKKQCLPNVPHPSPLPPAGEGILDSIDRTVSICAPSNMRNFRIYIDQNIVGYVHEGILALDRIEGVDWIYSNEHFNEIARSESTSLLSAFDKLKAQKIEIQLDENFRITDNATIYPYSSPFEQYRHHIETIKSSGYDALLLTELLGRFCGADNYRELCSLPDRLKLQVEELLIKAGILNEFDQSSIEKVSSDLRGFIEKDLCDTRSLESLRKDIGADKGKVGKPKTENPIQDIWEVIGGNARGLTPDQFLGFDPKDKQGYDRWPMYLGIIGCHTMLNFIGYGTDKGISKVKSLPNIMSDATHIALASFCDAVISEDARFCKKASAIYKYKNHPTQVLHLEIRNHHQ